MESGRRSKNFTEREKMLVLEVAKEYVTIIDNKKTDAPTVEAKKQAWREIANKYNAVSETGIRTEKQLHDLYYNLKKRARRNISGDKSEMCKTGECSFCPKTGVDDKVVALLTPQIKLLDSEFDSSAPYYNIVTETQEKSNEDVGVTSEEQEDLVSDIPSTSEQIEITKTTKKKSISSLIESIIKKKYQKQINEDVITQKKLEILEIQKQQELVKLEKTKRILDLDIELKQVLLENAKIDLEIKKIKFMS